MRIAVANHHYRQAGGSETYLSALLPALAQTGHEIGLLAEIDAPASRSEIELPAGSPCWIVEGFGRRQALHSVRRFDPDVLFCHGLVDPHLEAALLEVAPAVFFMHNFYGTCISGEKTFKSPIPRPCQRRFGGGCLLHYYPHRCGGLNPMAMWNSFQLQSARNRFLHRYQSIVTNSRYLAEELARHGLSGHAIHLFPQACLEAEPELLSPPAAREPWRLLFLGRMDFLKGGHVLLEALPAVLQQLEHELHVSFAGDGPNRQRWESMARSITDRHTALKVEFTGWLSGDGLRDCFSRTHLLVMPSLWPEPFGLAGLEAGLHGVPTAAFATGGIPEWLEEGVNGCLADADPPRADALSQAIVRALADLAGYASLRHGAFRRASKFTLERHLEQLMPILETAGDKHASLSAR
ncbi:MAG TPA: glycosyltransferase family 4 protein [Terriglobales bacterium]|nr:glycosyltransferase family 4 protein [Terriglobales bacterium]